MLRRFEAACKLGSMLAIQSSDEVPFFQHFSRSKQESPEFPVNNLRMKWHQPISFC
jgi:hypothetical protein